MRSKTKVLRRTPTTTPPLDPDAYYWESAAKYERTLCDNVMGVAYDNFVFASSDAFTNALTWKEYLFRLRRLRSFWIQFPHSTPAELNAKFEEDLPDGYLD